MSNDLLDSPIELRTIRKPYFSAIEFAIMIFNGLFIVLGVLLCWYGAISSGNWIFFINPPCFILLFGLTPLLYVRAWRKASIEYDRTNDTAILSKTPTVIIDFLNIILVIAWSLILLLALSALAGLVNAIGERPPSFVVFLLVIISPFVILGPVQFLFIRMTRKIQKSLLD